MRVIFLCMQNVSKSFMFQNDKIVLSKNFVKKHLLIHIELNINFKVFCCLIYVVICLKIQFGALLRAKTWTYLE